MNTLQTTGYQVTTQQLTREMFNSFIYYIDRTEKTVKTYTTNIKQFMAWLRYANVNQPLYDDIRNYKTWLSNEHKQIELANTPQGYVYRYTPQGTPKLITLKANTVKQYLQAVKLFFNWTSLNGLYPNVAQNIHAPKIDTTQHRKDYLKAQDVVQIEKSIKEHANIKAIMAKDNAKDTQGRVNRANEQGKRLYAMYLLAVNVGLRTIELSRANIEDLEQRGNNYYIVIQGKGHTEKDRKKAIAKEVYEAVQDYLQSRTDNKLPQSPLFVSTGNRSNGKRIASTTISKMLKQALVQGGYDSDRLTAHSLRHTTGQNVMELTGNNIYETQFYMRHTSPQTTEIYIHEDRTEKESKTAQDLYNYFHANEREV